MIVTRPSAAAGPLCCAVCRQLHEGDIINIDVTVYLNGYHGDTSRTFFVGKPSSNAKRLVEVTEEALQAAIKVQAGLARHPTVCRIAGGTPLGVDLLTDCAANPAIGSIAVLFHCLVVLLQKEQLARNESVGYQVSTMLHSVLCCLQLCGPGVPISAIGAACSEVAQKHKVTVVRDFIGHGVGSVFHAAPQVMHHRNNELATMQVGAALAAGSCQRMLASPLRVAVTTHVCAVRADLHLVFGMLIRLCCHAQPSAWERSSCMHKGLISALAGWVLSVHRTQAAEWWVALQEA